MNMRKKNTENRAASYFDGRVFIYGLSFIFCLQAQAQLKLSSAGAMAVLNGNTGTVPVAATTSPVATVSNISSASTTPSSNIVGFQLVQPNDRTLNFAYQSASVCWSAYLDYKAAAESLQLSGSPVQISLAIMAASYILNTNFVWLQNYNQRKTTMIIRANDQSPIHLPQAQYINGILIQLGAYTPIVSSSSVNVPVKF